MCDRIRDTLQAAHQEKGYSIEYNDALRILQDLTRALTPSHDRWIRNQLSNIDVQCNILWDPDNIFFVCVRYGIKVPEWYETKYAKYKNKTDK